MASVKEASAEEETDKKVEKKMKEIWKSSAQSSFFRPKRAKYTLWKRGMTTFDLTQNFKSEWVKWLQRAK